MSMLLQKQKLLPDLLGMQALERSCWQIGWKVLCGPHMKYSCMIPGAPRRLALTHIHSTKPMDEAFTDVVFACRNHQHWQHQQQDSLIARQGGVDSAEGRACLCSKSH